MTQIARLIATFAYVGYLRPAPGTWGSLAGVIAAIPLIELGGAWALAIGAAIAFAIGIWATARIAGPESHDPSEAVIDEVAGQWVTLLPLALILGTYPGPYVPWLDYGICLAIGFVFFRLFDILKPWPVSWADRRDDALGVMLDDIIAGVMAAVAFLATLWVLDFTGVL